MTSSLSKVIFLAFSAKMIIACGVAAESENKIATAGKSKKITISVADAGTNTKTISTSSSGGQSSSRSTSMFIPAAMSPGIGNTGVDRKPKSANLPETDSSNEEVDLDDEIFAPGSTGQTTGVNTQPSSSPMNPQTSSSPKKIPSNVSDISGPVNQQNANNSGTYGSSGCTYAQMQEALATGRYCLNGTIMGTPTSSIGTGTYPGSPDYCAPTGNPLIDGPKGMTGYCPNLSRI